MPSTTLFAGSLRLLVVTKRTIALLGLQIAPALLFLFAANGRTDAAAEAAFIDVAVVALFGLVVPICAIVMAASAIGAERRDQTLSLVTLRPIARPAIAVVKFLAAWFAAFLLSAVGIMFMHIALIATTGLDGRLMVAMVVAALVANLAYAAIYLPLGFITDRAVIIGLAFLLVFENGVVTALPGLAALSPSRVGVQAIGAIDPDAQIDIEGVLGSLTFDTSDVTVTAVVYVVIGLLATATLLRRRDMA